jgi:sterol desaturase/sphingolipid hydroxylase (fatty acid hydroxylase superfamily)
MESIAKFLDVTAFLMLFFVFVPLERLAPFHAQPIIRRNWFHDLSFWVLNRPLIYVGAALMITGAFRLGGLVVPDSVTQRVGSLPLWIGVPSAILVADLTFYTVHRASHAFPILWQFHSVHHSIRELDWLAGVRVHPVDQLITTVSGACVQLVLGFSPATVGVAGAIYLWHSTAVHCNVRIPLGPLARVIVGPTFHPWHHRIDAVARDRNFAGQLAFLDWIFGTAYDPIDRSPTEYGVEVPVPDAYGDALLYPAKRLIRMVRGTSSAPSEPNLPQ